MSLGPLSARDKQIELINGRETSAELWAESPNPPDPDDLNSKSAKTWAGIAEENANTAQEAAAALDVQVFATYADALAYSIANPLAIVFSEQEAP